MEGWEGKTILLHDQNPAGQITNPTAPCLPSEICEISLGSMAFSNTSFDLCHLLSQLHSILTSLLSRHSTVLAFSTSWGLLWNLDFILQTSWDNCSQHPCKEVTDSLASVPFGTLTQAFTISSLSNLSCVQSQYRMDNAVKFFLPTQDVTWAHWTSASVFSVHWFWGTTSQGS